MNELIHTVETQIVKGIEETHGIDLFDETHKRDECPICFEKLPIESSGHIFMSCCGHIICQGCDLTMQDTENGQGCPFCRNKPPVGNTEYLAAIKSLAKRGCAEAALALSDAYRVGGNGVEVNNYKSLSWLVKAASLGSAAGYGQLSQAYSNGVIVKRCPVRRRQCLEISAKMGSIRARCTLMIICNNEGDFLSEKQHREIAASAGCEVSMKNLFQEYRQGGIAKKRLDEILKHYQENMKLFSL